MKKRILLFFVSVIFIVAMGYSQTITVTNPHSGDIWYKGSSYHYTIRWTKSGTMNANVKIRLYQGETRVLAITDSTPNDGEYEWSIPDIVDEGTYKIRVKTIDNAVYDDSDEFNISNVPSSSPTITVTNPNSGDVWYKGSSHHYTIRWTKSGTMNANVKIRLYQGDTRVLGITDSTPNDGEYEWSIPDIVDEGTYKIRIKTVDNEVYDDGENFEIREEAGGTSTGSGTLRSPLRLVRDFEIKDIYYVYNRGGWIAAKIKNYYNVFEGDLKFLVTIIDNDTNVIRHRNITKHLRINAGAEKVVYLLGSSEVGDFSFCGKSIVVFVDPDNEIAEVKEDNNTKSKIIYTKRADLSVSTSNLEVKKAYLKPTHKWRIKFKIHVKAEGIGYSSLSNVYVSWRIDSRSGRNLGPLNTFDEGPFTINLNEEKIINVNQIFGHPRLSHSIRPRLPEGYYIITVRVRTTQRLCESSTTNNTRRFTIHLH